MNLKWIGTAFVILGCGGFGFRMAAAQKQLVREMKHLLTALDLLTWELRYQLTPLPDLCLLVAKSVPGSIGRLFRGLYTQLQQQIAPDAGCCMNAAVAEASLSQGTKQLLRNLGRSLGRFDLEGQLQGINAVKEEAEQLLDKLEKDRDVRLRSYQTLGLCAGAALAILLL